eukprot:s102_g23.t1
MRSVCDQCVQFRVNKPGQVQASVAAFGATSHQAPKDPHNDLTTTSLGMMVRNQNPPNMSFKFLESGLMAQQASYWDDPEDCQRGCDKKKQRENPPRIIRCEHGAVDLALISSLEDQEKLKGQTEQKAPAIKKRRLQDNEKLNSHRSGLRATAASFVYSADRPFDPLRFEEWIEAGGPPKSICRAKGLLWMQGIPRHVIFQLSGCRTNPFETVPAGGSPSSSRLVFIGAASALKDGDEEKVRRALDACLLDSFGQQRFAQTRNKDTEK